MVNEIDSTLAEKLDDGSFYDKDYFEVSEIPKGYGGYEDHAFFKDFAQYIHHNFLPRTALDFGCGKGFIVKWLRRLGVDAKGIDISEYAVAKTPEECKEHVTVDDMRSFNHAPFDVVISLESMEHILPKDMDVTIKNLANLTNEWAIISTPAAATEERTTDSGHDISHVGLHTNDWWTDKFKEVGFEVRSVSNWFFPTNLDKTKYHEAHNCFLLWKLKNPINYQFNMDSTSFKNKLSTFMENLNI
jgi:SAM-dependent methyltransferase